MDSLSKNNTLYEFFLPPGGWQWASLEEEITLEVSAQWTNTIRKHPNFKKR